LGWEDWCYRGSDSLPAWLKTQPWCRSLSPMRSCGMVMPVFRKESNSTTLSWPLSRSTDRYRASGGALAVGTSQTKRLGHFEED
jgi:hypothetical protein